MQELQRERLEANGALNSKLLENGPIFLDGGKIDTVYILVTRRKINSEVLTQTVVIRSLYLMLLTIYLKKSVETPISLHLDLSLNSRGLYPTECSGGCNKCINALTNLQWVEQP